MFRAYLIMHGLIGTPRFAKDLRYKIWVYHVDQSTHLQVSSQQIVDYSNENSGPYM